MTRHLLRVFPILFLALCLTHCESDPSKDSDNPGLSVPIRPPRNPEEGKLQLEAQFDGQFVKGLQIQEGNWSAIGPQEDIVVTFKALGMREIGQFDIIMEPDPPTVFDIAASIFMPDGPFITMDKGVEQQEDGKVRLIGVDLQKSTNGDATLGTLKLKTVADFSTRDELRLRVVFFSIGPSSTERDNYETEDLSLGVLINEQ